MLLASTARLPDWDLPSLRSSRGCDTVRIVLSFLVCTSGLFSRTWSHYTALADVDKAGLEFTETRLSAGIKATRIMPSPGAFLSCRVLLDCPRIFQFLPGFMVKAKRLLGKAHHL